MTVKDRSRTLVPVVDSWRVFVSADVCSDLMFNRNFSLSCLCPLVPQ